MINLLILPLIYKEIMLNVIDFNVNYFFIIYYVFIRRIKLDTFLDTFLDTLHIRLHGEDHNLLEGVYASVWMYRVCTYRGIGKGSSFYIYI